MGPREELNRLKWTGGLGDAKVTFLHRGAPNDERTIGGGDIIGLGRGFMRIALPEGEVEIPYHRILRIEAGGRVLWRKRGVS